MLDLEMAIREEVAGKYEQRYSAQVARLQNHFQLEQERADEHMNSKLEALGRGLGAYDGDEEDKENELVENLEENKRLRRELEVLKRELGMRSPEKRRPLAERDIFGASVGSARGREGSGKERNGTGERDGGLSRKMAD